MTTHYDTLHVSKTASPAAIKTAYRKLSQKWHPDKNPDNYSEADKLIKIINSAYEVLSDPIRRKQYDAGLSHHQPSNSTPGNEAQRQASQQTRHRTAEHAQRWTAEEFHRRAAHHAWASARKHHPQNSLLAQLKFAFNFLCILCFFIWVVVMFLTA